MGHLDPKQPPTKRKPYASILALPFISKAELILPKELYEIIQHDLESRFGTPSYSRVILPLSALLEGDFFNEYIKKGDILMLSEGTRGIDNVYFLRNGVLTLSLNKETYERAGLVGKPEGVKGNRGTKPRWVVEINLRLPSMIRGKKGFDRLVYACQNAIRGPVTWLFADMQPQDRPTQPIDKHYPNHVHCTPILADAVLVKVPQLRPPSNQAKDEYGDDFGDFCIDLHEWLSLLSLESPRISVQDQIDPYLSRYAPPGAESESSKSSELIKITWRGFLSSQWAHKAFAQAVQASSTKHWFAYNLFGFSESMLSPKDCGILRIPGSDTEYLMWEVEEN